ncbi:MAG: tRNA (guanosine(37)-N1)-methyltransferase TrmD [Acidobacteria bacterium]|nr:tRNA (guanosine(37)-N1)-methyltransferase TrmD [Acidobacteriota bacterium]
MIFHILTIFPSFFEGPLKYGVVSKAMESGLIDIRVHNLRDWTTDRHSIVDDRPFGGGEGMVLKVEPVYKAIQSILPQRFHPSEEGNHGNTRVVLLSAQGRRFQQQEARSLLQYDQVLLICGRYEGVDERITDHLVDDELSIGDFVLSGGELPAAVVVDSVARLVPGVLGNVASSQFESFSDLDENGAPLLDCPHYTRPADFNGWLVPDVLLAGNHAEIKRWRAAQALAKRQKNRPDLTGGTNERG